MAHSTDQITYAFRQDRTEATMTVHFTPQGAIDLVTAIHPDLANEPIIKLKEYYDDFTSYFNRSIDLKINGQPVSFSFQKGDLVGHDAIMVYKLDSNAVLEGDFRISITSFTEIYHRVKNYVIVDGADQKYQCVLDSEQRDCSMKLPQTIAGDLGQGSADDKSEAKFIDQYSWILVALAVVILALLIISFKNPIRDTKS